MRKTVAGKTAKAIDVAPATAVKAKKPAGVSRVARAAPKVAPPRISLAALAAMDTTSKVAKTSKTAQPAKLAKVTEVAKVPVVAKAPKPTKTPQPTKTAKVAKTTEVVRTPIAADITDAATDSNAANGKRTLRGIKLAWNLGAAATDASLALSAPVAQEVQKAPAPAVAAVNVPPPPPQPKPTLKIRPATPVSAPQRVAQPSFLAGIWAYLRNPPAVTLAGLAALAVALAFFAATQDDIMSDDVAAPALAGPGDAPALYSPGDYPPVAHPSYPGPDYGAHANYHEGRLRY